MQQESTAKDYKIQELIDELKRAMAIIDNLIEQKISFEEAKEEIFLMRLRTSLK